MSRRVKEKNRDFPLEKHTRRPFSIDNRVERSSSQSLAKKGRLRLPFLISSSTFLYSYYSASSSLLHWQAKKSVMSLAHCYVCEHPLFLLFFPAPRHNLLQPPIEGAFQLSHTDTIFFFFSFPLWTHKKKIFHPPRKESKKRRWTHTCWWDSPIASRCRLYLIR